MDGTIAEQETADLLSAGWIAVERDQIEAVAQTIDKSRINSVQAVAIVMMLVAERIGECRMRDLIETMTQVTEVPSKGIQTSSQHTGSTDTRTT